MKMLSLMFVLSFLASTIGVDLNVQSDFTSEYEKGYKHVTENLDKYSKAKTKDELVNQIREDFEIREEVKVYSLSEITSNPKLLGDSKEMNTLLIKLNSGIESSKTYVEFLDVLATFEQGARKDLSGDESKNALEYAKLFKEIMEATKNDLQFHNRFTSDYEGELVGWWSSWGKCAAGIVGGTLTGGVAGAGIGGGLGLLLGGAPVVPGAIIGGIVGAIGGGLTGAAAAC